MLKSVLGRLALLALGLALGLAASEAVLQVGAAVVRWSGHTVPVTWIVGRRRIVCLGDSNTYGINVRPDQPYPQVLGRLIAESAGRLPSAEVLNLGFPGTNSSKIRYTLPRVLRELRPDLVFVMVGVNDWWTEPEIDPAANTVPRVADWLYRHSRVCHLLYMLKRSAASPEVSVERNEQPDFSGGTGSVRVGDAVFGWHYRRQVGDHAGWTTLLQENLRAIAQEARDHGAQLVFLTYPADERTYRLANATIREEAAATGTPLIDLAAAFHAICLEPPCSDDYVFWDFHPTARGHAVAAAQIRDWLLAHQP